MLAILLSSSEFPGIGAAFGAYLLGLYKTALVRSFPPRDDGNKSLVRETGCQK